MFHLFFFFFFFFGFAMLRFASALSRPPTHTLSLSLGLCWRWFGHRTVWGPQLKERDFARCCWFFRRLIVIHSLVTGAARTHRGRGLCCQLQPLSSLPLLPHLDCLPTLDVYLFIASAPALFCFLTPPFSLIAAVTRDFAD